MGRDLYEESPRYRRFSYSEARVGALLRGMVGDTLVCDAPGGAVVAEDDGRVVGTLVGVVAPLFFSDDKVATDYTFYLRPEYRRRGRAAVLLLRAFEDWAISAGAVEIVLGATTLINNDSTVGFLVKSGYSMQGYQLSKRVRA